MRWVYILQCENDYFYIGETYRLYRRFWEHDSGKGGINTLTNPPINIVAIYSVDRLGKFFEYVKKVEKNDYTLSYNIYFNRGGIENFDEEDNYDNLWVENNITEKMMLDNENWNIRGGKYTRSDVEYKTPNNQIVKELPNCNCGFPCDVKQKQDYLYFRCAKKNIWDEMRKEFDIDDPCDFFMKYTKDDNYKIEYEKKKQTIKILTNKSVWLKEINGFYEHCIGGCGKEYDENNTIRYSRKAVNLCFDCFIDKNKELSEKYTKEGKEGKCLIKF